jgi:nicotinamide mononucleotide transporter
MKKIFNFLRNEFVTGWTPFNWCFLVLALAVQGWVIYATKAEPMTIALSIASVYTIMLTSKAKISLYFFGFLMNLFTIYFSLKVGFNISIVQKFCVLGFMIFGALTWKNHMKGSVVETKRMSLKQWILVVVLVATIPFVARGISLWIAPDGNLQLLDGFTLVFEFTAMILMTRRFKEQWIFAFFLNSGELLMWILVGNWPLASMKIIRLVNCIYGFINWTRLEKQK